MVDEGLTALAGLTPVRGVGRVVGVGNQLLRPLRPIRRHLLDKRRDVDAGRRNGPGTFLCAYGFHSQIIPVRLQASGHRLQGKPTARTYSVNRRSTFRLQQSLKPEAYNL